MLAIELGWFYAEVGRQLWILRGYMRVSDAVTTNSHVDLVFWLFAVLYALLGVVCLVVLSRLFKNKPAEVSKLRINQPALTLYGACFKSTVVCAWLLP